MYISYHILLKNTIYSKTLVYETAFIPPLKSSGFSALMFIKKDAVKHPFADYVKVLIWTVP